MGVLCVWFVMKAVDRAANGLNRFIFVAVRPPGHHAGCRGAVPAKSYWKVPIMCSSGKTHEMVIKAIRTRVYSPAKIYD